MSPQLYLRIACLTLVVAFTSCSGQVKPNLFTEKTSEPDTIPGGRPKLIKTQGSNEYANIHCGLQDKTGNLWFGTTGEGVYRYDGKSFTQFTTKEGLSNNCVWSMAEDKAGNIWFGTDDGISRYDGTVVTAVPIPVNPEAGFYSEVPSKNAPSVKNDVWSILQDKSGIIWFGTRWGVYSFDGKSFSTFPGKSIINKDSVHLKMVDSMLEDKKGNIWFASGMIPGDEGICRYDGKTITRFKPYGGGWIRTVIEGKDGNIYIATRHNGVCRFDSTIGEFINISAVAGIHNSSVTTISADHTGNIWIGTELGSGQMGEDGGVWRYDGAVFTRFTTNEGLIHNGVYTIVADKSGNTWFGTRNTGLCRYDGKTFIDYSD